VENDDAPGNYVFEDQLEKIPMIKSFVGGYEQMKKVVLFTRARKERGLRIS